MCNTSRFTLAVTWCLWYVLCLMTSVAVDSILGQGGCGGLVAMPIAATGARDLAKSGGGTMSFVLYGIGSVVISTVHRVGDLAAACRFHRGTVVLGGLLMCLAMAIICACVGRLTRSNVKATREVRDAIRPSCGGGGAEEPRG